MKPMHPDAERIVIDRHGDLFHQGVKITHQRTIELFLRNLRRAPDGGYLIEVGRERASVEIEDAPLLALRCSVEQDRLICLTNDGQSGELMPESLWIGGQDALYGVLAGRGLAVRFSRQAHVQAAEHVEPDPSDRSRFVLRLGRRAFPIAAQPPPDVR